MLHLYVLPLLFMGALPWCDAPLGWRAVQVPGAGVEGVCQKGGGPAVLVRFGSLDFVCASLPDGPSSHITQVAR